MKTDQVKNSAAVFLQTVAVAVAQLKQRLQRNYEQGYPHLRQLIQIVVDQEESQGVGINTLPASAAS